jgi:hypothetical protein
MCKPQEISESSYDSLVDSLYDSEKFHVQVMNVCDKKFKEKINKKLK